VISRRFKLAVASGAVFGATIVAGFGPVVRHFAAQAGERYGAGVSVEHVFPALGGVRLHGVDVTLDEVPSARVHVDEVVVTYGLSGRTVALRGGVVSAVGPREVVLRQAEAWRAHHLAADGQARSGDGGGRTTDLSGLRVSWQDAAESPAEALSASDLHFAREGGRLTVSAGEASATLGRAAVSVKNGRIELQKPAQGGGYRVAGLAADAVDAELTLPLSKNGALKDLGGSIRPARTGLFKVGNQPNCKG